MNILLRSMVFVVALSALTSADYALAQEVELRFEDYEQRLNAILKTRRDEEREFVQQVITRVKNGLIPERLVETSFKWVQNKRPNTNYPFVYFERVLRIQAKRLELEQQIPVFDYDIYKRRVPLRR